MENNELLQSISDMMDQKLRPIHERLDKVDERLDKMESQIKRTERNLRVAIRESENLILQEVDDIHI